MRSVDVVISADTSRAVRALERAHRRFIELEKLQRREQARVRRLAPRRRRARASRWRRSPQLVVWGGREIDYQYGSAEDRRMELVRAAGRRAAATVDAALGQSEQFAATLRDVGEKCKAFGLAVKSDEPKGSA